MEKNKFYLYLGLMMGIIAILFLANLGLYIRMNQLQTQVVEALQPFQPPKGLELGVKAPTFHTNDVFNHEVSLNDFIGRKVVLVFSSTTCSVCQQFWPTLNEFKQSHPDLNFLMVSKGTPEESQEMIRAQNFAFPVVPWEESIVSSYKIPGVPYFYVLDETQKIIFAGFGDELDKSVATIGSRDK
jgi:peroxiredoxin